MNEQNLKSLADRSPEERKEIARLGGLASGEARRRSKQLKDVINDILFLDVKETTWSSLGSFDDEPSVYDVVDYEPETAIQAIALRVVQDAMKGEQKAIQIVLSCVGLE